MGQNDARQAAKLQEDDFLRGQYLPGDKSSILQRTWVFSSLSPCKDFLGSGGERGNGGVKLTGPNVG